MENPKVTGSRWDKRVGLALFLGSLAAYLLTLCPGAAPGESARLMVQHLGLDPTPPLAHYLWGVLARVVAAIPLGSLACRLNILSALFAAGVVWLFFDLTRHAPHDRTTEETRIAFPIARVQRFTGIVAALFLAVSQPFWIVATRAHTAAFNLFLLLLSLRLLLAFIKRRQRVFFYGFVLVYALTMTEFATCIALAPVVAAIAGWALWRVRAFRFRTLAVAAALAFIGWLPYVGLSVSAWLSSARIWQDAPSYFSILWTILRGQYQLIRHSFTQSGWMIVFAISLVPWLMVVVVPKRTSNPRDRLGSYALHALLAVLAVLILFNTRVAPWVLLRSSFLIVTPCLLIASWAGYVAGYGYVLLCAGRHAGGGRRRTVRYVYAIGVLLLVAGAGAWGMVRWIDRVNPAARLAEAMIDELEGQTWLVTDGLWDDNLRMAAAERRQALTLLDLALGDVPSYRRYLVGLFPDARRQGLAAVGLMPLIIDWLLESSESQPCPAFLTVGFLGMRRMDAMAPGGTLYRLMDNPDAVDPDKLMEKQRALWTGLGEDLLRAGTQETRLEPWRRMALQHLSRLANDLGVWMEDRGELDFALESYAASRHLHAENRSAFLNARALAIREKRPEADALAAEVEQWMQGLTAKLDLGAVVQQYGVVRDLRAPVAREAGTEAQKSVQQVLKDIEAGDLARAGDALQSLKEAGLPEESLLPLRAWLARREENTAEYQARLAEMAALVDRTPEMRLFLAAEDMQKGDINAAQAQLSQLLKVQPGHVPARAFLLRTYVMGGQRDEAERQIRVLLALDPRHAFANYVLASIQRLRGEDAQAEASLLVSLKREPTPEAFNDLAWLQMEQGRLDEALRNVERSLEMAPRNVSALDTRAVILSRSGRSVDAENDWRQALELNAEVPVLRVHLAEHLLRQGRSDEAKEQLAIVEAQQGRLDPDSRAAFSNLQQRVRGSF